MPIFTAVMACLSGFLLLSHSAHAFEYKVTVAYPYGSKPRSKDTVYDTQKHAR